MSDERPHPLRRLCIRLPNGEEVTAPTEEWVAALIVMLPEPARQAIFERVRKKIIGYTTPGSYVLRAEGLEKLLRIP